MYSIVVLLIFFFYCIDILQEEKSMITSKSYVTGRLKYNKEMLKMKLYSIYIVACIQTCRHYIYTVKPVDEVTSIEQSPVLKGHLFLSLS